MKQQLAALEGLQSATYMSSKETIPEKSMLMVKVDTVVNMLLS